MGGEVVQEARVCERRGGVGGEGVGGEGVWEVRVWEARGGEATLLCSPKIAATRVMSAAACHIYTPQV